MTEGSVWNIATGKKQLLLKGHKSEIWSAAYSLDGNLIVTTSGDSILGTGGFDFTARVWDAATGREVVKLEGHSALVSSAMFSPDGARIVTTSHDRSARVWDTKSGQVMLKYKMSNIYAPSVGLFQSSKSKPETVRIIIAGLNYNVQEWDAEWLVNMRGPELVRRACAERLIGDIKLFTPHDAADPILAGLSGSNPCERVGPLSLDYWARMFR